MRAPRVGSGGVKAAGPEPAFIAVGQSGFVSVMAVGDDELVFLHRRLNGGGTDGIRDHPQAVHDAVFIAEMASRSGGLGGFEDCVDALPGIRVEHEELASMCARVAKEFEAVRLGTG